MTTPLFSRKHHDYQSHYCEENAWRLCRKLRDAGLDTEVLFISNYSGAVALWNQKAAPSPLEPVVWDYHVIVVGADGNVFDLDSLLRFPTPLGTYLAHTFVELHPPNLRYAPLFRMLPAESFLSDFSSDRSHMCRDGVYLRPPPPWTPIFDEARGMQLHVYTDFNSDGPGQILSLQELLAVHRKRQQKLDSS